MATVTSNFDGGNIAVVSISTDSDAVRAELKMQLEPYTEGTDKRAHHQWFYFK
jgi:hypothetical protein